MITISSDEVRGDIERHWRTEFAEALVEKQQKLASLTEAAQAGRDRVAAEQVRKAELEELIQKQYGISAGCKNRAKTHAQRSEMNRRHIADLERELTEAQRQEQLFIDEEVYCRRRFQDLEDSRPVDTSNYQGRLAEYQERLERLDNEIEQLEREHKEALRALEDDETLAQRVEYLAITLEDLQRKRRLEDIPHENLEFLQQLRDYESRLESAREKHRSAEKDRREAAQTVERHRDDLSFYQDQAERLAAEPEEDARKAEAAERTLRELEDQLQGLRLEMTPNELELLRREAAAERELADLNSEVERRADETFQRFLQGPVGGSPAIEDLAVLTARRREADDLWREEIELARTQIAHNKVPDLQRISADREAAHRAAAAKEKELRAKFGGVKLTNDERNALEAMPAKDFNALRSGQAVTYDDPSDWQMGIGCVLGLALAAAISAGASSLLESWTGEPSNGGAILIFILLAVPSLVVASGLVFALVPKKQVKPVSRDDGRFDAVDTGKKYAAAVSALNHRNERELFEELQAEAAELDKRWAEKSGEAGGHLDRILPAEVRRSPLNESRALDEAAEDFRASLTAAALGQRPWPNLDVAQLKAQRRAGSPTYVAVWDRWAGRMREKGLAAFVD